MGFTIFSDSRGQSHTIYMQEKISSCGIACIATIIHFTSGNELVSEAHLRQLSQRLPNGYKPHPADVKANGRTFIAELIEQRQASGLLSSSGSGAYRLSQSRKSGINAEGIANLLTLYNLYSDKGALKELDNTNETNYVEKLKSKIVLLGIQNKNQCDHAILIRDVWEDGTLIIYDPAKGLVETKNIEQYYDLFPYSSSLNCAYAVSNDMTKELDLESGCMEPKKNEMLATHYQQGFACTLI
jgi:hypothetical protein